jgi:tRNA G18 (ribose-2'-O)-methylase SpoU
MQGSVGSLNAAVAGSIALYESRRLKIVLKGTKRF